MEKGLIHVYYGGGKGKTTCGMGLCIRAAGAGLKVLIVQFLKTSDSSEVNILKTIPGITYLEGVQNPKFIFQMSEEEKERERNLYRELFLRICRLAGEYDVLFMDEILHAVNFGMISKENLVEFLKNKPEGLEIILTGYHPAEEVLDVADYVSFIDKVKHPFDQGIPERIGIEK